MQLTGGGGRNQPLDMPHCKFPHYQWDSDIFRSHWTNLDRYWGSRWLAKVQRKKGKLALPYSLYSAGATASNNQPRFDYYLKKLFSVSYLLINMKINVSIRRNRQSKLKDMDGERVTHLCIIDSEAETELGARLGSARWSWLELTQQSHSFKSSEKERAMEQPGVRLQEKQKKVLF